MGMTARKMSAGEICLRDAARVVVERLEASGSPSRYDARSMARHHTAWAGDGPAREVSVLALRTYLAELALRQSASRVRAVGYFLAACLDVVGVEVAPRSLKLPRRYRAVQPREILTLAQVARLVRSRRGHPAVRAAVALLLLTGARASEARGLRVGDVDTSGPTWVLRYSEQLHPKSGARAPLKDRVAREIPLHPELRPLLEAVHGEGLTDTAPDRALLPSPRSGLAWDDNALRAAWREYLAAHGAPAVTPHAARHTAISLYLEAGADEVAVRAMTHPASPTTGRGAFSTYVHVSAEARARAVLRLCLPLVAVADASQLSLDLGGSDR